MRMKKNGQNNRFQNGYIINCKGKSTEKRRRSNLYIKNPNFNFRLSC